MALEVVLAGEFGSAIGAAMFLRGRGSRAVSVVARVGQAEAATRIIEGTGGHGIGKRLVTILVDLRVRPRPRPVSILGRRLFDGAWTRDRRGVDK
jgi:hypothetical protein